MQSFSTCYPFPTWNLFRRLKIFAFFYQVSQDPKDHQVGFSTMFQFINDTLDMGSENPCNFPLVLLRASKVIFQVFCIFFGFWDRFCGWCVVFEKCRALECWKFASLQNIVFNVSVPCASLKSPSNQQQKQRGEDVAIEVKTKDVMSASKGGLGGKSPGNLSRSLRTGSSTWKKLEVNLGSSAVIQGAVGERKSLTMPRDTTSSVYSPLWIPPLAVRDLLIKAESQGHEVGAPSINPQVKLN